MSFSGKCYMSTSDPQFPQFSRPRLFILMFLAALPACSPCESDVACGPPICCELVADPEIPSIGMSVIFQFFVRIPPEDEDACQKLKAEHSVLCEQVAGPDLGLERVDDWSYQFIHQECQDCAFRFRLEGPSCQAPDLCQWVPIQFAFYEVCPGGLIDCGGICVDITSDPDHCGGCGNACSEGLSCVDGVCQN